MVTAAVESGFRARLGVLLICFALNFVGRGMAESFTVFVLPLCRDFEASRASVVSIQSLTMLTVGLSGPFIGWVFDRVGPRWVFALGLGLLGAGQLAASAAGSLLQVLVSIGLTAGLGMTCLGNVPSSALLSRWFSRRLTMALSILFAGSGIGVLLLVPLAQLLIDQGGWRSAYQWLGLALLVLVLPVLGLPWRGIRAGIVSARPGARVQGPSFAAATRHPAFWLLSISYFFSAFGMFSVVAQVVAYLVEAGFSPMHAAAAWGTSGILLPIGMILFGWLDSRIGQRQSIVASYAFSMAGIAVLWLVPRFPSDALVAAFIVLFGGTQGSRGPLISAIAMGFFRGDNAGKIMGTIMLGAGLGSASGIWIAGLLRDWTGGYDAGLAMALITLLLGVAPFVLAPVTLQLNAATRTSTPADRPTGAR
jgi:MFS family permease